MEYVPKEKIEQLFFSVPAWTSKGYTKECKCGKHINYLSKICPYCEVDEPFFKGYKPNFYLNKDISK